MIQSDPLPARWNQGTNSEDLDRNMANTFDIFVSDELLSYGIYIFLVNPFEEYGC